MTFFSKLTPLLASVILLGSPGLAVAQPAASLAAVDKAAGHHVVAGPHVRFVTTKGSFEIVLFPKEAPKTVSNFIGLVKKHFYDGTSFHRVIPGFVAQGGDPLSKKLPAGNAQIGTGGSGHNVPDEFKNGLKHLRGSVAMAHSGLPNSASSQFYVSFKPLPFLDGGYTVFGQVTKGMEVVDKLAATEKNGVPVSQVKPDKMLKVTLVK